MHLQLQLFMVLVLVSEIKSAAPWYISDMALQSVIFKYSMCSIYDVTSHIPCNLILKP